MTTPAGTVTPRSARRDKELLNVRGLVMGFGASPDVLRNVDVTLRRGEFVSVIGPSGCGKSTIMNAVSGLLKPRAGEVTFDGQRVNGINTRIGYMTQGDTLLPWRDVRSNVRMPLTFRKVAHAEAAERVDKVLEMLDLGAAADKYPAQLSGGMKRRALLARSMIYEPSLLLMDEPFAALDAQLRTQLHSELLRTVELVGQAVLFITHDIYEAVLLSDRVIVLGGTPATVTAEFEISFHDRRNRIEELRFDPEFVDLEHRIHVALNEARSGGKATDVH